MHSLAVALLERIEAQPGGPPGDSSEPLAAAQTGLARQEQASLWLAVDCLKRRDQKELALSLAQLANSAESDANESSATGKGLGPIGLRLELARLRLELGQREVSEKELETILDALLPP